MKVDIFNRLQATNLLPIPNTAIISISRPNDRACLMPGWEEVLFVEFDDALPGEDEGLVLFTSLMAEHIKEFVRNNLDRDFIIHCDAGISRSVAIGVWMMNIFNASITTHAIHTIRHANVHVLVLLMKSEWIDHFKDRFKGEFNHLFPLNKEN